MFQVINTIEKSSQITTEVGKARAWLRLALNDGLLVSLKNFGTIVGQKLERNIKKKLYQM